MTKDNQPRQATKEQNEDVAKQVRRIVIDQIVNEEVEKRINSPENQLKLEMLTIYKQLTENTVHTKESSQKVLDELKKVTDLVSIYRTVVDQIKVATAELNEELSTLRKRCDFIDADLKVVKKYDDQIKEMKADSKATNEKLVILAGQYKRHAERLNKIEKLK